MPRSEQQFQAIRTQKRERIIHTALELFAYQGYHPTSIADIAKNANISKGLIYNYFESKATLVKAILHKGLEEFLQIYDSNKDGALTPREMQYFIEESYRLLKEQTAFWRLYFSLVLQPSVFPFVEEIIKDLYDPVMKSAISYFQSMNFEHPEAETFLFGAILDGISLHYMMDPENYPLEKIKSLLIQKYCQPNTTSS